MENIMILLFDILLWVIYLGIGFVTFMIIQLISYRVFKFNLYKKIDKILFR